MTFVVATLPIELWRLVFGHCDFVTTARLGAMCTALHAESIDRTRRRWHGARSAVNAFVDRWQSLTARWDVQWADDSEDPYPCEACSGGDDNPASAIEEDRPTAKARWFCENGVPDREWVLWACDSCARAALDHPANADGVVWPVRRADTDRPHVWSIMHFEDWTWHLLWSDVVDDQRFQIPPAAIHLVDGDAASILDAWVNDMPMVRFSDMSWTAMGSVRGWMPLVGAHTLPTAYRVVRVPMVCCDAESTMWGAVALVDCGMTYSEATWYGVEDSLEAVLARHRRTRAASRDADGDWAVWAGDAYIDAPRRARKAAQCDYNVAYPDHTRSP